MKYLNFKENKPLVAVWTLVYNHEPYLRDYFEGIVMQKTDFPFVAIVHDDCSTDGSAAIIRKYAEKYPNIIKPIFETENQYSLPGNPLGKIMQRAVEATGAKYIAICEGDDYWTDPLKLQKQVDFLESHPDYSMCFHAVKVLDQGVVSVNNNLSNIDEKEYTTEEIFHNWTIPTCSAVFTSSAFHRKVDHPDFIVGDNVLWAACISTGKIFGFHETMGMYRRNPNSWTHQFLSSKEGRYKTLSGWVKHYSALKECYPNIKNIIFDDLILLNLSTLTVIDFFKNRKNLKNYFFLYLRNYKFRYILAIIKRCILMMTDRLKRKHV